MVADANTGDEVPELNTRADKFAFEDEVEAATRQGYGMFLRLCRLEAVTISKVMVF